MKFTANYKEFSKPLRKAESVSASYGVLIEADEDSVSVTGFNGDICYRQTIPAEVEEIGARVWDETNVRNILDLKATGPVTIETEGLTAYSVKGADYHLRGTCSSAQDYPAIELPDDLIELPIDEWLRATKDPKKFTSKDLSRPIINGIHLVVKGDTLCAEATNGHVLIRRQFANGALPEIDAIIPSEVAALANPLVRDSVRVKVDGRWLHLVSGDLELQSRLIEGPYPQVVDLFDAPTSTRVVELEPWLQYLKSAKGLFKKTTSNRLCLDFGENVLKCAIHPENQAELTADIPIREANGPDLALHVNGKYLLNILSSLSGDTVTVGLRGQEKALSFNCGDTDGLLMPLRILE